MADESRLLEAVGAVVDPELRRPLGELGMIRGATLEAGVATIDLALTIAGCPAADRIERDVRAAAQTVDGVTSVEVVVDTMSAEERKSLIERVRGVRTNRFGPGTLTRVIAVGSGKGGVGKSTVAANLAIAFSRRGLKVGIMDLDVHGFSIPGLLGIAGERPTRVDALVMPPEAYGIPAISIGMFVEGDEPVSWRGPMLHRTIEQFLSDVWFGELDLLVVDLPPGTGDAALSFGQLVPNAEFLLVTTPQPAAAEVAVRAGLLARRLGQRLLGVVENMAGLPQADGTILELFGSGGGDATAARLSTPDDAVAVLARIPLSIALRAGGDSGAPIAVTEPRDPAALAFRELADAIIAAGASRAGRPLI
ncbi:MAG TPA: Mrp/NBP35 family ATP-binding protein [Microbacteriaceae bacterium]|nr:Mrp/NBP35 family ATP-binding protein [Microbacteriaceae bacterium]